MPRGVNNHLKLNGISSIFNGLILGILTLLALVNQAKAMSIHGMSSRHASQVKRGGHLREQIFSNQFTIGTMSFPNPFDNVITIRFSAELGALAKVELVDLNGKSRYQQENVANNTSIDLSSLADRIYVLTISPNGSNTSIRSKFVNQRK